MSQSLAQFLDVIQILDLYVSRRENLLTEEVAVSPVAFLQEERLCYITVSTSSKHLPSPSPKRLMAFCSESVYCGNRNTRIFLGLLDPESELTLIPRNLKCHYGPTYEGQVIMESCPGSSLQ